MAEGVVHGQTAPDLQLNAVDLAQYDAHPEINDLAQDELGFIWIASDYGLYRFDGVIVRHHSTVNTPGLPGNMVYSILAMNDTLWIATNKGLALMNIRTEVFRQYPLTSPDTKAQLVPTKLHLAKDSSIWIGMMDNHFARVNPHGVLDISQLKPPIFALGKCFSVNKIAEDYLGNIFLEASCAYRTAIFLVNSARSLITRPIYWGEIGVGYLVPVDGTIYLHDIRAKALLEFNYVTEEFTQGSGLPYSQYPGFYYFGSDQKNTFLAGSRGGTLYRCTLALDSVFVQKLGQMAEDRIQVTFLDRSGCLWVGSRDGVVYFADRHPQFRTYLSMKIPDQSYGLRTRAIIEHSDGYIYNCSDRGLHRIDPRTSNVRRMKAMMALPYSACTIGADILVGSDGYALYRIDTEKDTTTDFLYIYNLLGGEKGTWMGELVMDSRGILWIGTNNGILFSNHSFISGGILESESFSVVMDSSDTPAFQDAFVHDIKEFQEGSYWIGTNKGLFEMTMVETDGSVHFEIKKHQDVPYRIREICHTKRSELWLATEDAGLIRYRPGTGTQQKFTEVNGLPNHVLYSLLQGPKGELWIGTFEGLSRFDTVTGQFNNFYVSDGLPNNEFNSQSQLIASDGRYYMGTQDGIVSFDPEEFTIDSSDLPVVVSGLRMHNTRLDSIIEIYCFDRLTSGIEIGPSDNLVSISYAIADYNKPGGNRFQYMLQGISSKWHYIGNQTELVLPHLRPGDYKLHIRGAGSDGRWSTQVMQVPIHVRTAFYNTWWFSLAVLCFLTGIMWLIHRYRLNQVLKLQRMRLRIAEDLHDELGSSLTGIGIQTQILSASDLSPERTSKLKDISVHIQDAVSKLGDIVWSLQPESGSLGDLIDRVEEQAHLMLDHRQVDYQIRLPQEDRDLQLRDIVKQNTFLIFKEALTNIVKHSDADKVVIMMARSDSQLLFNIGDNGEATKESKSIAGGNGLKNIQSRATKMGGELNIYRNGGFRIEVVIPKAFVG